MAIVAYGMIMGILGVIFHASASLSLLFTNNESSSLSFPFSSQPSLPLFLRHRYHSPFSPNHPSPIPASPLSFSCVDVNSRSLYGLAL
jgi:hypothetical protein